MRKIFFFKRVIYAESVRTIWEYQGYFKPYAYINHNIICLKEDLECQISYRVTNGRKNLFSLEF